VKKSKVIRMEMEHTLKSCEFFELLEPSELSEISKLGQMMTFQNGEYVFRQGDYGEHIYTVVDGQIYLERTVDLGAHKGNVVIEILGKGRVLGCWSTLLDMPHILMSSAVCKQPTKVVAIKGAELRRMMIGNAELGFNLMERLCFLLRDRIQAAYGAMEKI
jgi:CRP/FNR family cyclic AMP-dependent transcriptional regulator